MSIVCLFKLKLPECKCIRGVSIGPVLVRNHGQKFMRKRKGLLDEPKELVEGVLQVGEDARHHHREKNKEHHQSKRAE